MARRSGGAWPSTRTEHSTTPSGERPSQATINSTDVAPLLNAALVNSSVAQAEVVLRLLYFQHVKAANTQREGAA